MADPTDVTGLVRRWRADTIAQADASAVSSWAALVGGVALAQGTGADQPTYRTSSINSLPGVRWDGVTDSLSGTITTVAQPVSFVVVVKHNGLGVDQEIINNSTELHIGTDNVARVWGGTADVTGGTADTNPHVLIVNMNGASSVIYRDGTSVGSGNPGANGAGATFQVGRFGTTGRPMTGDIAEILLYNHTLTAGDRSIVDSYVQDRYAITVSDYVSSTPTYAMLRPAVVAP